MKIFRIFFILFIAVSAPVLAELPEKELNNFLNGSHLIENRIYLKPGMIYVTPDQILLNIEGNLISIENLSADENGVYVTIETIMKSANQAGVWICKYCKRRNLISDRFCQSCGRDPRGNL